MTDFITIPQQVKKKSHVTLWLKVHVLPTDGHIKLFKALVLSDFYRDFFEFCIDNSIIKPKCGFVHKTPG